MQIVQSYKDKQNGTRINFI